MKNAFKIIVFCFVLVLTGPVSAAPETEKLVIAGPQGQKHEFEVELALDRDSQTRGLMFRETLPDDGGMLFFFEGEEMPRAFWMMNTLIPLDMIFIRKDGTIHHIHSNAIPHDLTGVPSNGSVQAVLEVKGGTAKRLGIEPGFAVYNARFFGNEFKP